MNNIPTNKVSVLVLSGVNIGIDYHKCDGSPPGETMTYVSLGLWSMACDRSLHRQSFWVTCEVEWFLGIRDLCLKRKWIDFLGFMYHLKKSARSAYKQTRTSGLKLVKGLLFWFEKFIEPFSCISSVHVLPRTAILSELQKTGPTGTRKRIFRHRGILLIFVLPYSIKSLNNYRQATRN